MSETRRSSQMPSKSLRRRASAAVFATGMATGAVLGIGVNDKINDIQANNTEPACSVKAGVGDTVYGIRSRLIDSGGRDAGEHVDVIDGLDGHVRNIDDDRNFADGSMGLQAGDRVRFDHVNPQVCSGIGGVAVEATGQANKL